MKKEFDFDKVGKRTPYKVPAGFFADIADSTVSAAENQGQRKQKTMPVQWRALSVAASLAVLLLVSYLLYKGTTGSTREENAIAAAARTATVTDTLPPVAPAVSVARPSLPQPEPEAGPEAKKATIPGQQQQPQQDVQKRPIAEVARPETLEDLLASISDEELQLLAAIVKSEQYVYEQTID